MPIVGAIVGATAVGKTALAIRVAQMLGAEIACMDSRQVYRGFRIGTAQPSSMELAAVPHRLVDFLDPAHSYSAARFAEDVKAMLATEPQMRLLLVGGTGLYLQTLVDGLSALPAADEKIREELKSRYAEAPPEVLYAAALAVDAGIGGRIMPGDTQRLLRVLEVAEQGAGKFSDWMGKRVGGIGPIPTVWLDRPREELYQRINQRVETMFDQGWADEVKALSQQVDATAPAWQSLGYGEIRQALLEKSHPRQCLAKVQMSTRHYAKRQLTWFRHQTRAVRIEMAETTVDALPEKVMDALRGSLQGDV